MAIVPGTNVIARELTVAVPGSVGLEDGGGDGLGQLIDLAWCSAAFGLYGPPIG